QGMRSVVVTIALCGRHCGVRGMETASHRFCIRLFWGVDWSLAPRFPNGTFQTKSEFLSLTSLHFDETEPFRLQANIIKMIDDIIAAGGSIALKGVPTDRYTPSEIALLKGIRPNYTTSKEIRFVVDRELMRDREFS
ncbi:MAG: hypothetical protein K9K37_08720, partial [Desulfocapsa sp.]|nr:hypothetical protein [Desulfocapsa sp.]